MNDFFEKICRDTLCLDLETMILAYQILNKYDDIMHVTRHLILESKISDPVILFLDNVSIMLYRDCLSVNYFRTETVNGQCFKYVNELVHPGCSLSCEHLRRIFTLVELLVFKCAHILIHDQKKSFKYTKHSYKFKDRVNELNKEKILSIQEVDILNEIFKTRSEFIHSIQKINRILYRGNPLKQCFSSKYTIEKLDNYFLDDIYNVSETLLSKFKPIQYKQINLHIFIDSLKNLLA